MVTTTSLRDDFARSWSTIGWEISIPSTRTPVAASGKAMRPVPIASSRTSRSPARRARNRTVSTSSPRASTLVVAPGDLLPERRGRIKSLHQPTRLFCRRRGVKPREASLLFLPTNRAQRRFNPSLANQSEMRFLSVGRIEAAARAVLDRPVDGGPVLGRQLLQYRQILHAIPFDNRKEYSPIYPLQYAMDVTCTSGVCQLRRGELLI